MSIRVALLFIVLATVVATSLGWPWPRAYNQYDNDYYRRGNQRELTGFRDQEPEAQEQYQHGVIDRDGYGHGGGHGHHGRVKIQVYRGPTKKVHYSYFAPWGYYVHQPEDYHKQSYGHSSGYGH